MSARRRILPLVAGSLLLNNICIASEQMTVWEPESYILRGKTTEEKCQRACNVARFNTGKIAPLISSGWKILSSTPKEVVCIDTWAGSPRDPIVMGCSGTGTQYVLQKEEPAPVAKAEVTAPVAKAEVPGKEEELSKREIDLLKRENDLLKQEIESLKAKIEAMQKKK